MRSDEKPLDLDGLEALIRAAIKFADWAAGEGICPVDQSVRDPETFLMEYSNATGDEDWETYAERISSSLISRVRSAEEERDAKNRDEFNRGYLIAVSTMMHQHGDDVIASDCLKELGVSEGILRKLGFDDFDAKPLRKLFRHLSEQARFRRARTALKGTSNDQG